MHGNLTNILELSNLRCRPQSCCFFVALSESLRMLWSSQINVLAIFLLESRVCTTKSGRFSRAGGNYVALSQPAFICSKLQIETLEQGMKHAQS